MSSGKDRRLFGIKISVEFLNSHTIKILKGMKPNGLAFVAIYFELMSHSAKHKGRLRFSDELPYQESDLAALINAPVEIVSNALEAFRKLKVMILESDGTFYFPHAEKMIWSELTNAERMRKLRKSASQCDADVTRLLRADTLPSSIPFPSPYNPYPYPLPYPSYDFDKTDKTDITDKTALPTMTAGDADSIADSGKHHIITKFLLKEGWMKADEMDLILYDKYFEDRIWTHDDLVDIIARTRHVVRTIKRKRKKPSFPFRYFQKAMDEELSKPRPVKKMTPEEEVEFEKMWAEIQSGTWLNKKIPLAETTAGVEGSIRL